MVRQRHALVEVGGAGRRAGRVARGARSRSRAPPPAAHAAGEHAAREHAAARDTARRAAREDDADATAPSDEAADRVVIPTEELQPDAAVTFPVDI